MWEPIRAGIVTVMILIMGLLGYGHSSASNPSTTSRAIVSHGLSSTHPKHKTPSVGYWSGKRPPSVITHPQLQKGTQLSCSQVGLAWLAAGGSRGTMALAEAEASAESDRWTGATNQNPGSIDRGLFQMNSYFYPQYSTARVSVNVRGAVIVSQDGKDWEPWVSYDHHAEYGLCGYR
jgi:hypothetical protein